MKEYSLLHRLAYSCSLTPLKEEPLSLGDRDYSNKPGFINSMF